MMGSGHLVEAHSLDAFIFKGKKPVTLRLFLFPPAPKDNEQMQLPQELADAIIDYFSDDRKMLQVCSLVATDWLARSRYHLFNAITMNGDRAKRWCSAIRPDPDG